MVQSADAVFADRPRPLSICIINPKFEPSYFGLDYALPLTPGRKLSSIATGALPALAALAPDYCLVELLDENVEPIDFERLKRFDVIGVTGMVVQQRRMREILLRLKSEYPGIVAVGGPYVSVAEDYFDGLCDVRFIGEAEETWPAFLDALSHGRPTLERYEQIEKTDMATVPPPRYDLLKADRYVVASLQFSRGCPFLCEFCDIITIFGRRPRTKTPEQMVAEFETIRKAGFTACFLVDDNFIGNKQKAKEMLRALIAWQKAHGYPVTVYTEASLNLADEPELLDLMIQANFRQVFIGLESPRAESLAETRKNQNIRGDGMLAKIQRIRDAGLVITSGFIVGFDADDETIFEDQYTFIQASGIAQAAVAILSPIPTTPLYDRLRAEGRLDFSDPDCLFHPKSMSREQLKRGYSDLVKRLYEPDAYFGRLLDGYEGSPSYRQVRRDHDKAVGRRTSSRGKVANGFAGAVKALELAGVLARAGELGHLGGSYWRQWWRNRRMGREALPLSVFVRLCIEHWHFYNIAVGAQKIRFGTVPDKAIYRNGSAAQPAVVEATEPDVIGSDAEPVTVIILSRNRPLYLWACLDSLYRYTRHPARFVFVDNQSDDPLVREVVGGFERRGMFSVVEWHDTNSSNRIFEAIARHRDPRRKGFLVVVESDVAVFDTEPCWLSQMVAEMEARPELGVLGSYIDVRDFVDPERARALEPDMDAARRDGLIKRHSPERGLPEMPPPDPVIDPFNPPGRLVMVRQSLIDVIPPGTDSFIYREMKAAGMQAGISTRVLHRHLSLLNLFDYPGYDMDARDRFVNVNGEDSAQRPQLIDPFAS